MTFGGFVSLLSVLVTALLLVETTTMGTSSGGEESEISETISHRLIDQIAIAADEFRKQHPRLVAIF